MFRNTAADRWLYAFRSKGPRFLFSLKDNAPVIFFCERERGARAAVNGHFSASFLSQRVVELSEENGSHSFHYHLPLFSSFRLRGSFFEFDTPPSRQQHKANICRRLSPFELPRWKAVAYCATRRPDDARALFRMHDHFFTPLFCSRNYFEGSRTLAINERPYGRHGTNDNYDDCERFLISTRCCT